MRTIEWDHDRECPVMIDQTKLPAEHTTFHAETVADHVDAIRRLVVRGAPALGAAGAYGVALAARRREESDLSDYRSALESEAERIANARPTAVNLERGVREALEAATAAGSIDDARESTLDVAEELADRDVARNKQIGEHGASLLADGDTIMTHCNAGALATVDWGTALGVVYSAAEQGKEISVIANETRPLNQGARLTTVELADHDVPVTLIPDNASGLALQQGRVDAVITGADRVVLKGGETFGDQAVVYNKIGTYKHAVIAERHDVPFYVAAPRSTVDEATSADDVEIEQRDPDELRWLGTAQGVPERERIQNAPADCPVWNPAFDATPAELLSALVTETGVFEPPLSERAVLGADAPMA